MSDNPRNQLWIDLETTGLDPHQHSIIEVAAALTHINDDGDLVVDYEDSAVIRPYADNWTAFCVDMHQKSGLYAELSNGIVGEEYFKILMTKIRLWRRPKEIVLAGRSVHFDRSFLRVFAPDLEKYLHHRHLDMSAIEMFLEHAGVQVLRPQRDPPHRAKADLQYAMTQYRECLRLAEHHLRGAEIG